MAINGQPVKTAIDNLGPPLLSAHTHTHIHRPATIRNPPACLHCAECEPYVKRDFNTESMNPSEQLSGKHIESKTYNLRVNFPGLCLGSR